MQEISLSFFVFFFGGGGGCETICAPETQLMGRHLDKALQA